MEQGVKNPSQLFNCHLTYCCVWEGFSYQWTEVHCSWVLLTCSFFIFGSLSSLHAADRILLQFLSLEIYFLTCAPEENHSLGNPTGYLAIRLSGITRSIYIDHHSRQFWSANVKHSLTMWLWFWCAGQKVYYFLWKYKYLKGKWCELWKAKRVII